MEAQFIDSWSEVTAYYRENADSLGSRLHQSSDGSFYGYAQWKSDEQRQTAFRDHPPHPAGIKMKEAIEERFEEIVLDVLSDYLLPANSFPSAG